MTIAYPRMRLSRHFWLHEALFSGAATRAGIDNRPALELLPVLCHSANGMERVRRAIGDRPIVPSSWYRSRALNERVGGARKSQHVLGEAVDFRAIGLSVICAAQMIAGQRETIMFDQMILEYPNGPSPWVHISFSFEHLPRGDVLHIVSGNKYKEGLGSWA